ncbi:ATP-binding protein [Streptococcus cameli]
MTAKDDQLRVISFEPNLVQIEIVDFDKWKQQNTSSEIKLGSILKIEDGDNNNILCQVKSFKMVEKHPENSAVEINSYQGKFLLNTQPIGRIQGDVFKKGIHDISIPPNGISIATDEELKLIYSMQTGAALDFAKHRINDDINIVSDGDKLFSKHLAVVGSTGSGKSCTVAKVIQELKVENEEKNNTHLLLFDIHGEYRSAFPNSHYLSIEDNTLTIPYWLMNSEELEDLFIESSDLNSYNQVSQFKFAVTENKKHHNPNLENITYDTPVYFDINEVLNYIKNKNAQTHFSKDGEEFLAIIGTEGGPKSLEEFDSLWWDSIDFAPSSGQVTKTVFGAKITKAGGFNGEFERFISRMETKLKDKRLKFLLHAKMEKEKTSKQLFIEHLQNIIGYTPENESNITIIDLSSIPFEIVSIVVSIVSRMLFDFSYAKTKKSGDNDTPFMVVYEEAHKYIPRNNETRYRNTRLAVERIAKEGRKYGLSAMIVSQRPSELSSTVFSQCTNFIIMRLTNPDDQSYVKRLLPEASMNFGDELSSLEQREALLVGDAFTTPTICKIKDAAPTPKSDDVKFFTLWKEEWKDITFDELL